MSTTRSVCPQEKDFGVLWYDSLKKAVMLSTFFFLPVGCYDWKQTPQPLLSKVQIGGINNLFSFHIYLVSRIRHFCGVYS